MKIIAAAINKKPAKSLILQVASCGERGASIELLIPLLIFLNEIKEDTVR
ncbi:hypothetical protein [Chryseobacterium sp. G0162]|nr:hypothetical protein [Chryseobacterium sp. G0162]